MNLVEIISPKEVNQLVNKKPGDKKIGETLDCINQDWEKELNQSFSQFVLVNIPEDVGTKAAGFIINTKEVFENMLRQFLNFQDNLYLHGGDILLLGKIETKDIIENLNFLSVPKEELFDAVDQVDQRVYSIAKKIFEAGKVPIFIGGGQNNAYPILKAHSEVYDTTSNCLNIAAHTSLRPPDGRHARNGYSYALSEGYLEKYYVFGLHESEIPHSIYEFILANYNQIGFTRFEAILKNDPYLFDAIQEAIEFITLNKFGLEVNLNSVSDIIISPDYPDGFLLREVRQLVRKICIAKQPAYFHICEARSGEKGSAEAKIVGKSLALLVADFIKSYNHHLTDEEE